MDNRGRPISNQNDANQMYQGFEQDLSRGHRINQLPQQQLQSQPERGRHRHTFHEHSQHPSISGSDQTISDLFNDYDNRHNSLASTQSLQNINDNDFQLASMLKLEDNARFDPNYKSYDQVSANNSPNSSYNTSRHGSPSTSSVSSRVHNPNASTSPGSLPDEEKRRRNTEASARFRIKKKLREQEMENTINELTEQSKNYEGRLKELKMENNLLKSLIVEKNKLRDLDTVKNLKDRVRDEDRPKYSSRR